MGRVRETDDGWVSAGGGAVPAPGACQASRVEGGLAGPAGPVEGSDWPPDAVRQGRSEEKKVPRLHPSSLLFSPCALPARPKCTSRARESGQAGRPGSEQVGETQAEVWGDAGTMASTSTSGPGGAGAAG